MKIYLGADHRGVAFKSKIKTILTSMKVDFVDLGTGDETTSCDYPVSAYQVASKVAKNKNSKGILVCMSGIGQAIAANKVKGAYAALCYNAAAAQLSRRHNNANVLVLSSKFINPSEIRKILTHFLTTKFEGGRHLRRLKQIQRIEKYQKL